MTEWPRDGWSEFEVVLHVRKASDTTGLLSFDGKTLSFRPHEPGGALLNATSRQLDWVRRTTMDLSVKPVDQPKMRFALPDPPGLRSGDGDRRPLLLSEKTAAHKGTPAARFLDAIPAALHEQGVSVRQSVYDPMVSEPPFRRWDQPLEAPVEPPPGTPADGEARSWLRGLVLGIFATSVHVILIAPLAVMIALVSNVLGVNSDSNPRSWSELGWELLVIAYGVAYFIFARRHLPGWKWLQRAMILFPVIVLIVMLLRL